MRGGEVRVLLELGLCKVEIWRMLKYEMDGRHSEVGRVWKIVERVVWGVPWWLLCGDCVGGGGRG